MENLRNTNFEELKKEAFLRIDEFVKIFENEGKDYIKFFTFKGTYSDEVTLDLHLKEWKCSRINGGSATMCFYGSCVPAIKLLDQIAKELINDQ